jgi:ribosomal protein L31E
MAETIRNCLKRRFNAREIRLAQTIERGLKARGQDNGGFSHA